MTEEEAKTKWCPFARTLGTLSVQVHGIETVVANGPHNRGFAMDGPLTKCLCIASACMAWRGKETLGFQQRAERAFRVEGRRLTPTGADLEGYCGLAGAPQ